MKMSKEDKHHIKILEKKIAGGDLDAMMEYAWLYHNDFPEEVTPEIAQKMVACYEKCLAAGDLTAALNLGAMYYSGVFIPRDFLKAVKYYEQATESDDYETQIRAWTNLGYCHYYGRDIPVDYEKAFNCYMRAAICDDPNALYKIGDMYRYGRHVAKDEKKAAEFYEQALENIYRDERFYSDVAMRIGECSLYGIGMEKNIYRALKMLTRAEADTIIKIRERDPFAASLLPKIKKMLDEARRQVDGDLNLR